MDGGSDNARSGHQPSTRLRLIVIHGGGSSLSDALGVVDRLQHIPARWENGAFLVPQMDGLTIRGLLHYPSPSPVLVALQKLTISGLLNACSSPADVDETNALRLDERRLFDDFAHWGLPLLPQTRKRRAQQLRDEAQQELSHVQPTLLQLRQRLIGADSLQIAESAVRGVIEQQAASRVDADGIYDALCVLRDMSEIGGDLDTVASAVLYAQWLNGQAIANGNGPLGYGRDYRFVFVNYHQGIQHLAQYGPATLYMADMPIGALPDFAIQVRELKNNGVHIARFDDHHPYTHSQMAMLTELQAAGDIGALAMSGPVDGDELPIDRRLCAADMVYDSVIKGHAWDTPAMRELRDAAHAEDWVTDQTDTSAAITALIKGGTCKVDMAQRFLECRKAGDLRVTVNCPEWQASLQEWNRSFGAIEDKLWDRAYELRLKRRPEDGVQTGTSLGGGSDVAVSRGADVTKDVRLLVVMAYRPEPGAPKVPVGKVAGYFARACPEVDYLFYCYGSSLLVARRLSQADVALNLGNLMPKIGGPGDGGHSGAAVCRPDANPAFSRRLLGRVHSDDFERYCHYLATRIADVTGRDVSGPIDRSRSTTANEIRRGGKHLVVLAVAALVIGLILILVSPVFRSAAIADSNVDFFPSLQSETAESN